MSDKRVRLHGTSVTHTIRYRDGVGGNTYCSVSFAWCAYANIPEANTVEDDCDCMTCLIKESHAIRFLTYSKLKFPNKK